MRDRQVVATDPAGSGAVEVSRSDGVVGWLGGLISQVAARPEAGSDAERIDRIVAIDALIAALGAARVVETAGFCDSQLQQQRAAGVADRRLGAGIAEQVALARKMSPASGRRYVGLARTMADSMPQTLARMARGQVSEWVASLVVRETATLTRADRRVVDRELAPLLASMSPRQAEAAARRRAYALDPAATLRRSRTARSDRRVSIRPAPDTMASLTGFLPVEQGVAAWASLDRHARGLRASGDVRSLGQIMADTMVERLTGQPAAAAVPVEIGLTISLDTLTGAAQTPAWLPGHGPLPAPYARALAHGHADPDPSGSDRGSPTPPGDGHNGLRGCGEQLGRGEHGGHCGPGGPGQDGDDGEHGGRGDRRRAQVFLRRLFTDPVDGHLVGADARRRRFDGPLARFIVARDQTCRSPYCDAPIRHLDHIRPHRDAGPTTADNGRGVCANDNHAKEAPGWTVQRLPGPAHPTVTITPTGHRYHSIAPPALGP